MKAKKLFSKVLAPVVTLSLILSGCGGSAGNTNGSAAGTVASSQQKSGNGVTEVSFWALSTRQTAVEQLVSDFNAVHNDIKVKASFYDTDGIKDACKVAASSKTLPNMWFNWGGSLGGFYAENGLTYDLTDYAEANNWKDKFSQSSMDLCTLDGKLSGYPTSYNVLGVYYKKALFEQYGIEVPKTFEEFEQACATLKENGITPISTAGLNGWHTMRFVELLIEHYAGAQKHDSMNTFDESYDNDAVVQALAKYKEFCDKGYFPEGFLTQDPNDTMLALATGRCAMDIQGQWYDGHFIQNGQNPADYGVFTFPSGGSNRMSAFAEMTQFNVNNTPEQLEACMAFMDYYYSPESVEKFSEYYNLPLPTTDAKMPEGMPNVPVMLELSKENGVFTITDQAFPTEVADVLFNAQDAIANGQMTPEEGSANIQSAIVAYQNK